MSSITEPKHTGVPFTVGIALDGAGWHPAAWRDEAARADELFSAAYWEHLVGIAEAAGADYVTFADELRVQQTAGSPAHVDPSVVQGRLDALLTASWIAPRTHRIGLVPTVTTTHTEPFHVATALQTLDHISAGRAGWQLRISADPESAEAFGRRPAPRIDTAAVLAGERDAGLTALVSDATDAAEVARRLWDSWEADAVIRDTSTGRYLDRERVHRINFVGEEFSVVGPSIVPRSPQGQIVVTLLAHATPVYELAARAADVVFVTPEHDARPAGATSGTDAAEIVAEVRAAEAAAGRANLGLPPLRIVADLVVALDALEEPGVQRIARLDDLAGTPFRSDARIESGPPTRIAETIARWRAVGIDGVRLRPAALPLDLQLIAAELLPLLRARGLASPVTHEAVSLRERFGLAPAPNRYERERERTTQEVAA